MSDAPEKGVCDYAKRHRVVTHTSGNELQGPAITFGCYDSDRDARQALTDAGFTNGQWGWRNEYGYSTAHITPVLEYTGYRRADLPPTLEAAMQLPEVRALVEVAQMASEHYLDMAFHREGDVLRAALAPFDDDLNAAKALQTELARVICDAVNSMFNTDCAALAPFTEAKP